MIKETTATEQDEFSVAIIGMSGRFPGAPNIGAYWSMLDEGREGIRHFELDELEILPTSVDVADKRHVRAQGILDDIETFDAPFFNIPPHEARWLDPQQRIFLETCSSALDDSGYDTERFTGAVSVYAGASLNTYLLTRLQRLSMDGGMDRFQAMLANDKDFLATRVAYKLNLRGESISVQTACSSSLVAVHMACQSLLSGQSDMSLAGGVSIRVPQRAGYVFQEGMIASPDGHCRTFDRDARGTVPGSGVGVVVLKLLSRAMRDGDHIYAIIRGSAVNNDGRDKIGFTAPSIQGQSDVVAKALAMAGVQPDQIGFVEAHGTGTPIGDPIEVQALSRVFRKHTAKKNFCALGAAKSNIGHLDSAAGIAGLIKAVLCLQNRRIPATLHFQSPNPALKLDDSPFYVNSVSRPWDNIGGLPLKCGVSSFGVGGTNAHVVLEEAPRLQKTKESGASYLFPLSARTPSALQTTARQLRSWLAEHPEACLADVAYTLCVGRREFAVRATAIAARREQLDDALLHIVQSSTPYDASAQTGKVHWEMLFASEPRRRIPLPGYPFERTRHWVEMDPMPTSRSSAIEQQESTASGRSNDKALTVAESSPAIDKSTDRLNDIEKAVIGSWQEVLGTSAIGLNDNFFQLGGDSLLGTQVFARLAQLFPVGLELGDVLANNTVAEQANLIRSMVGNNPTGTAASDRTINVVARDIDLPLSFGQEWLWAIDQTEHGSSAYNFPFAARVQGALEVAALNGAIASILDRHEILRTSFPVADGHPVQRIAARVPFDLSPIDLSSLDDAEKMNRVWQLITDEARQPFDLHSGPMLRVRLFCLSPNDHIVSICTHHIVSDAWSMGIFARELAHYYAANVRGIPPSLPVLRLQYADYAAWQRKRIRDERLTALVDYWKKQLAGAPQQLNLKSDRPRPDRPSGRGTRVPFAFKPELTSDLKSIAQQHNATLFMVLLATLSVLLYKQSRQQRMLIGVPISGRAHEETENLIGCFINTLVMRFDLEDNPRFQQFLQQVRETTLAAYDHQDLPFERVVNVAQAERTVAYSPLVQVLFDFQNMPPQSRLEFEGLTFEPLGADLGTSKLDLIVDMWEREGALAGSVEFNTDLFDPTTIVQLMRQFEALLVNVTRQPQSRVDTLQTISDQEQNAVKQSALELTAAKRRKLVEIASKAPRADIEAHSNPAPTARAAMNVADGSLVRIGTLEGQSGLPLVVQSVASDLPLSEWAVSNRALINRELARYGALLFRDFQINSVDEFHALVSQITPDLLPYRDRSTPRTEVGNRIFTSTEYPPAHEIPQHNENSYSHEWPAKLWFFCQLPASAGGETPLTDSRNVFEGIDPYVRQIFSERKVMYVRNYRNGVDLDWQTAFQTSERQAVETYCRSNGIRYEWLGSDWLRTCQIHDAVKIHPSTKQPVWFNQAHLFHISSLPEDIRQSLAELYTEADLPRQAYYGDGAAIEVAALDEVRRAYRQASVTFPWKAGDVVLVDNLLVAHGRRPFSGPRRVLVAMAEPMR